MAGKPLIKIAVVGPESTGKSTMAEALAAHYHTVAVPEYAREYCRYLNRLYTLQDEMNMFYGQLALERALVPFARNRLMICDTMFLTVKVWCDHLFGYTPKEVLEQLETQQYDLYLLMDIDLPWEDDPLRDFPEQRQHFLDIWKKELRALDTNYTLVSGQGRQRIAHAIEAVDSYIKSCKF